MIKFQSKKQWLLRKLSETSSNLQQKPYKYFADLINKEPLTVNEGLIGSDNFYQTEINIYYDDKNNSSIRVMELQH
jgi:hypothetical protein